MPGIPDEKKQQMAEVVQNWCKYGQGTVPRKRKNQTLEHDAQRDILKYLSNKNIFHWRNNSGVARTGDRWIRYGTPGAPDIFAVVAGNLYGIEVKRQGGKQSLKQKRFQESMEKAGAVYILARSVEDVKKYFQAP